MPRKLKVYRAVARFHDVYVAATSRKAALAAWGADTDLFSAGMAEEVKDPDLAAPALKKPGQVLKLKRGTREQWSEAVRPVRQRNSNNQRMKVAKAEAALNALRRKQERELRQIEREIAALENRRKAMLLRQEKAVERFNRAGNA